MDNLNLANGLKDEAKRKRKTPFETQNGNPEEGQLLKKVLDLVEREHLISCPVDAKIVDFKHPKELEALLQLDITKEGMTQARAKDFLEEVVRYSVRTQHPHFYNQFYGSIDEVALAGAWLTEALNTNQVTYEVAPVFILMERYVLAKLGSMFGYDEVDGIFAPGGSISNLHAMLLARYKLHPEIKQSGIFSLKPLVAFASDQSHYSIKKAAVTMGLGLENVVQVKTDALGRIIPQELTKAVKRVRGEGKEPFFVGATCGSTVLGAYDPLDDLARICRQEGLWLHADACVGGAAVFSDRLKHNIDGIHKADSIAWNPHKMLCVPLQCSVFLTRHKGLLDACHSTRASYLFQQDKFYDVTYDVGDKSFQCGRKVDVFKLYFILGVHGLGEIGRRIEAAFDAAAYLSDQVAIRPGFRQVVPVAQCANTCFWFVPESLRGQEETPDWWEKLGKVAPRIKTRMVQSGTIMIGYQPIENKNLVNFFRMTNTCVPVPTSADMDFVLDEIERLGKDL
ncbi:cysteine sulfinic acid decarboxylase-like [Penaeus japonicus]|uniref:cysteine sulfinic acid decarboxylase-like n=1 Tax=Penaeus japonicus TaxID=27405 RepID=UPI001C70B650|nr:cysteine sulfinic acid decarboxylase-like [Penaeus japonicus]